MLKKLITVVLSLSVIYVQAQVGFVIKGKIGEKNNEKKLMLYYRINGESVIDSTFVKNGAFLLKGKVPYVVTATVTLKDAVDSGPKTMQQYSKLDYQNFNLENANYTIEGPDLKTALIKGGPAQADNLMLIAELKPLTDQVNQINEKMMQYYKENNEDAQNALMPKLKTISEQIKKTEDNFIRKHPDSYASLDIVTIRSSVIDLPKLEPLFNLLSARLKNTFKGKDIASRIKKAKSMNIGKPAENFTQNNTEGKPVSLASLKGKYVLLDFWASWCGPCRAGNPNLVKAYQKYKDKNFEILSISLDFAKASWLKAIKDDNMTWLHVSDLKGWKNAVALQYEINAVPQNLLIGPDGIIIAKNIDGDKLQAKLAELIKN